MDILLGCYKWTNPFICFGTILQELITLFILQYKISIVCRLEAFNNLRDITERLTTFIYKNVRTWNQVSIDMSNNLFFGVIAFLMNLFDKLLLCNRNYSRQMTRQEEAITDGQNDSIGEVEKESR